MDLTNFESLTYFYPEIILTGTTLLIVILDMVIQNKRVLAPFAAYLILVVGHPADGAMVHRP